MPSISPHEFLENDSKSGAFANYDIGYSWATTPQTKYSTDEEFKVLGTIMQTIMGRDDSVVPSGTEHANAGDYSDNAFQSCGTSSWEELDPYHWNSSQVLDWLYQVFSTPTRDYERLPLGNFRTTRGQDLVQMKREEFCSLLRCEGYPAQYTEQCADRAYSHLQSLINYRSNCSTNPTANNSPCPENATVNSPSVCLQYEPNGNGYPYDSVQYDLTRRSSFSTETNYNPQFDAWTVLKRPELEDFDSAESSGTFPEIPSTLPGANKPPNKRGPGRPPGERKKKSKGQRSSRLWEFIRDLLKNKETCPRLVKWEDREEGVFRFVQSDQVAKLWGERKSNPRMTYEKLSRAMRYYYKSNVLQPVLGRRLVYKFGPCATGWRPHEM